MTRKLLINGQVYESTGERKVIVGGGIFEESVVTCPNVTLVAYDDVKGDLSLNSDGSFTYDYTAGETTDTDSFTYRFTDDNGDSNEATVTLNITSAFQVAWTQKINTLIGGGF